MYSATTKVNLILNNYYPFSFVTHLLFLAVINYFGVGTNYTNGTE